MSREGDCVRTLKALQQGGNPLLSSECAEGLLQWLCGGRHGKAASPRRILGDPVADKHLVQRVYRALDATLFADENLHPIRGSRAERERRYRLLVRAFHPDRFPEMEKWLIPRSQSVNVAYAAFRNNPKADELPKRTVKTTKQTVNRSTNPAARKPHIVVTRQTDLGEWLVRITAPLSRSRQLPQKIMAVIVILCILLLVLIMSA